MSVWIHYLKQINHTGEGCYNRRGYICIGAGGSWERNEYKEERREKVGKRERRGESNEENPIKRKYESRFYIQPSFPSNN
jgi:hypothetical protein